MEVYISRPYWGGGVCVEAWRCREAKWTVGTRERLSWDAKDSFGPINDTGQRDATGIHWTYFLIFLFFFFTSQIDVTHKMCRKISAS